MHGLCNGKCSDSSSQYLKIKIWKSCQLAPYISLLKQLYWFSFEEPITTFCSRGLHWFHSMAPSSKSCRSWTPIVMIGCREQESTKLFSNLLKPCAYIWKSCNLMSKQFKKRYAYKGTFNTEPWSSWIPIYHGSLMGSNDTHQVSQKNCILYYDIQRILDWFPPGIIVSSKKWLAIIFWLWSICIQFAHSFKKDIVETKMLLCFQWKKNTKSN